MYDRLIPPERIHPWGDEDLLEATEQDRTRIVQAAPVRRLQQKTQVFPLDVKASVRSRLTHSLEVQETGRQISRRILATLPAGSVSVNSTNSRSKRLHHACPDRLLLACGTTKSSNSCIRKITSSMNPS